MCIQCNEFQVSGQCSHAIQTTTQQLETSRCLDFHSVFWH